MAEFDLSGIKSRIKKQVRKQKKNSTRVDLTPMVDLGFLLITFFMVTTAWTKPHVTKLNLPHDGDSSLVSNEAALTILVAGHNQVVYYYGQLCAAQKSGAVGIAGYAGKNAIGDIIRQKQLLMDKVHKGGRNELTVIIKPSKEASYENIVRLLDEMLINNVKRYALAEIDDGENRILAGNEMPKINP